jgi:predicted RNA binding protein YcfA (HicA-like mRNA interferase family)
VKLPRNLSGEELASALRTFGYRETRQSGSHVRLTTDRNGEHHVTVPRHASLKAGTLAGILGEVSQHLKMDRAELVRQLFG